MDARPLARFWQVYRRRGAATRSPQNHAYLIYVVVLLACVVAAPAVSALVNLVQVEQVLDVLQRPSAQGSLGSLAGALLAALAAGGTVRGPVVRSPFLMAVLSMNDLPRRRTLARPFLMSAGLLVAVLTVAAVVFGSAFATASGRTALDVVTFALGTAAFGVVAAVAWLVGQRAEGTRWWALGPGLGAVTLVGAINPAVGRALPWGWYAATWPSDGGATRSLPALAALVALATVTVACVPRILDSMSVEPLLGQARRWQSASLATSAGDLSGAMGRLRANPTLGRRWRAVSSSSWTTAVARSDVVGGARTPVRFTVGLLVLGVSGWLASEVASTMASTWWLLAGLAGALVFSALGVLCDGMRHAVSAAVAPQLYGRSDTENLAAHTIAPVGVGIVIASTGVVAHVAGDSPTSWSGLVAAVVLVLVGTVLRLYDSAKGQPPPSVLTPVSTPAGDLSAVSMLAWQLDALLLSGLLGILVVGTVTIWQPLTGSAMLLGAAALVVRTFARRLRAL